MLGVGAEALVARCRLGKGNICMEMGYCTSLGWRGQHVLLSAQVARGFQPLLQACKANWVAWGITMHVNCKVKIRPH